jgi:hypothetical protein
VQAGPVGRSPSNAQSIESQVELLEARRFLDQATLGVGSNELARLQRIGIQRWLDEQLQEPRRSQSSTGHYSRTGDSNHFIAPPACASSGRTPLGQTDHKRTQATGTDDFRCLAPSFARRSLAEPSSNRVRNHPRKSGVPRETTSHQARLTP